jgi:hypothetical protein
MSEEQREAYEADYLAHHAKEAEEHALLEELKHEQEVHKHEEEVSKDAPVPGDVQAEINKILAVKKT